MCAEHKAPEPHIREYALPSESSSHPPTFMHLETPAHNTAIADDVAD